MYVHMMRNSSNRQRASIFCASTYRIVTRTFSTLYIHTHIAFATSTCHHLRRRKPQQRLATLSASLQVPPAPRQRYKSSNHATSELHKSPFTSTVFLLQQSIVIFYQRTSVNKIRDPVKKHDYNVFYINTTRIRKQSIFVYHNYLETQGNTS